MLVFVVINDQYNICKNVWSMWISKKTMWEAIDDIGTYICLAQPTPNFNTNYRSSGSGLFRVNLSTLW